MKKSDENCKLLLEGFKGKENWKALKARGATMGKYTKVLDAYVRQMDIFEYFDNGRSKATIKHHFELTKSQYDLMLRQYKQYLTI